MKEALFYEQKLNGRVECLLCPHFCQIPRDSAGLCRVRENRDGTLYALSYAKTVTVSVDPMEKKPLYHFYPGQNILSLGPNSCNLSCDFCQNYSISQLETKTIEIPPRTLLEICRKHTVRYVAYTYTEPLTWYEYVIDSAELLVQNGIKTVLVSNGYINREPLERLLPFIDAMNIDLKGMSEQYYQEICAGSLKPVLETIQTAFPKCHLEITNLLIPGENDSPEMIRELINFVGSVSKQIPLHFSRYYPQFKRHTPPTPYKTLRFAYEEAKKELDNVYLGNIVTETEDNTYCPKCSNLLIERNSFNISFHELTGNSCHNCGEVIYGHFN